MEIRVLESAKDDIREGWKFYERNREGLGDYFLASVEMEVKALRLYAGIHEVFEGLHRILMKRFPFAVYDRKENGRVDINAILDCRRDPEAIAKRLKSSQLP